MFELFIVLGSLATLCGIAVVVGVLAAVVVGFIAVAVGAEKGMYNGR